MSRLCTRCGNPFNAKKNETECPDCLGVNDIMSIINRNPKVESVKVEDKPVSKANAEKSKATKQRTAICQTCGLVFEIGKRGYAPKICPDCRQKEADKAARIKVESEKEKKRQEALDKAKAAVEAKEAAVKEEKEKPSELVFEPVEVIKPKVPSDPVNDPSHYTRGKIEVIEFIEDQRLSYHLGNVLKYICRAGFKNNEVEDLKKAAWYLNRYIGLIEGGVRDERTTLPHA